MNGASQFVSDKLFNPVWFPGDNALAGYTVVEDLNYTVMASVDTTGHNFNVYSSPVVPASLVKISPDGSHAATQLLSGSAYSVVSAVWVYNFKTQNLIKLPGREIKLENGIIHDISMLGGWSPDSSMLVYSTLVRPDGYAEIKVASPQGKILKSFERGYYPQTCWGPS